MENHSLEPLSILIAIAECGSLTSAADRLGLTQPAVSYRLSKLEEALGMPLFERTGRNLVLNVAGRRALEAAHSIDDELNRLSEDLSVVTQTDRQPVRIATHCFTTFKWLPDIANRLRSQFPNCDIQIDVEATKSPKKFLDKGKVDFVLSAHAKTFSGYKSQFLFDDEIFAIVSDAHKFAELDTVQPSKLATETVIVFSNSGSPIVNDFMEPAGYTPASTVQMPLTEGMLELARAGQGVAALAGWMLKGCDLEGLVLLRLGARGLKRRWNLISLSRGDEPVVQAFVNAVRLHAQTG